jgi:hypothetical protein
VTEAEWLACKDPITMLLFLRGPGATRTEPIGDHLATIVEVNAPGLVSDRKLRLAACACCRRVWHLLHDESFRRLIEVNELYAEGSATQVELQTVWQKAADRYPRFISLPPLYSNAVEAVLGLRHWLDVGRLSSLGSAIRNELSESYVEPEMIAQCELIRDILGPVLFNPIGISPRLLTSDALTLAKFIYEESAFDRLPILADALMDAGCESEELLAHCRSEGPHVRGCWAVDLILGKS